MGSALQNYQLRPQSQPAAQAPPPTSPPPKGSLFIADHFQTMPFRAQQHGDIAAQSARTEGFKGPIIQDELAQGDNVSLSQESANDTNTLDSQNLAPSKFLSALKDYDATGEEGILDQGTAEMHKLSSEGANHSALNISYGDSKANTVKSEYNQIHDALNPTAKISPDQQKANAAFTQNASRAFGVNPNSLSDHDPKVAGAAKAKLQQGLIDQANAAEDGNPAIAKAKSSYNQAVGALASKDVAVDVSAGNDGEVLRNFKLDDDGAGNNLKVPPDFTNNNMTNSQTRVLGAEGDIKVPGDGSGSAAAYSSPNTHLTRYAHGVTKMPPDYAGDVITADGTSFASPRNAAVDAAVLGSTNLNVNDANTFIQNNLTKTIPNHGNPVTELDGKKAAVYMNTHDTNPSTGGY
jgi:hypothetical protein